MLIGWPEFEDMLRGVTGEWLRNKDMLSEIDSRFGDGDHGVTIGKIASFIERSLDDWEGGCLKSLIESLASGVMGISGGSAGPLYGTLIEGLAFPLAEGVTEIDEVTLKAMFAGSREALFDITKARVGDKTMMDALIPAVEAALAAGGDACEVLSAASRAASLGAKATEGMVSKFGRARSYGDKTLGAPDAGAVSTALFFAGLAAGLSKRNAN